MILQKLVQSKLIIGLGNPGAEYENTRHNIGFVILDVFSEKHKVIVQKKDKLSSKCGKEVVSLDDKEYSIMLGLPTTFMNNSGIAVQKLLNWYKLNVKDLIVVHDDTSLNLGKIRVSFDSSAGGHHGVESIIQHLNSQEFTRLRIGIGPDPGGDRRKDHVLDKFKRQETPLVIKIINISIQALEIIITKNIEEAMNKFNGLEIKT